MIELALVVLMVFAVIAVVLGLLKLVLWVVFKKSGWL